MAPPLEDYTSLHDVELGHKSFFGMMVIEMYLHTIDVKFNLMTFKECKIREVSKIQVLKHALCNWTLLFMFLNTLRLKSHRQCGTNLTKHRAWSQAQKRPS